MLNKEDIILLFLEDPYKLAHEIWNKNVPKSDEIRTLICDLGGPHCAYRYALCVDEYSRSDTRKASCKDPERAFFYAQNVDKSPRSDTRKASCRDPEYAYYYARNIDKSPHPDTRQAVQNNLHLKERYKQWENSYE